jgi:hypothetical protein
MPRRLFAAAAAGALALAALTGCRSDPSVAAYVGDSQITEAQVDKVITDVTQDVTADNAAASGTATQADGADPTAPAAEKAPARSDVVGVLVTSAVIDRALHHRGLSATAPDASAIAQIAQGYQIPARSSYAADLADLRAGLAALLDQANPNFQPTDADLRVAYDNAVAAGVAPPNDFNAVKPTFLQVEGLAQYVSVRTDLAKSASQAGITINPRYAPLAFPLMILQSQTGQTFVAVSLPLGKTSTASPAVVDVKPSPAATLPDQPAQQ